MEFNQTIQEYQRIVNEQIEKHLRRQECPEKVLNEAVEYSLMAGGKRLRPILMLQTYQLFAQDIEVCMPFAIAMEMIHNFSLIHDDLPAIDNDDFRHGKLTNHKKFNESTAIIAGDSLFNQAYIVLAEALLEKSEKQAEKLMAFQEFTNSVDKMILGEYLDTEWEGKQIGETYLEYIHQNKTGALLTACVRIGALLGGASQADMETLSQYAEKIGLTFQIKDDILSEIGDEAVLGKPVGNYKEKGKCTYVTKYGLEKAKEVLDKLTKEAVEIAKTFGEKGTFLKELAIYIEQRNK